MGDADLEIILSEGVPDITIYDNQYQLVDTLPNVNSNGSIVNDIDKDGLNELVEISNDGTVRAYDTYAGASNPLPRTNTNHYSERNARAAVYIPPPGVISSIQNNNISPQISNIACTTSNPLDNNPLYGWVNVSCMVTDYVVISEVILSIHNPGGTWNYVPMVSSIPGKYYYNSTTAFSTAGNYSYNIQAKNSGENIYTSNNIEFLMPPNWDINNDGFCKIKDFILIAILYGETGNPGWIREDIDNNGIIQFKDLILLAGHYGESWYSPSPNEISWYSPSPNEIVNSKGHSWSAVGSNIQLAINDLGSTGGTVYLPVTTGLSNGRLDVSQIFIPYNNIRIHGAGIDKTNLYFTGSYSFGLVASSNPGGSEDNWKTGISNLQLDNFSFYGKSIVLVIRKNCIVSDLNGYDIKSDWAAIRFVCPSDSSVEAKSENLKIINCHILRSSSHGFQLNAVELQGCVFDTVLFKSCSSTKAGCWEWSSHGPWSVGFDLAEGYGSASVKGGLTVRNLVVENCEAYECWESGFHFENKPIKQNIVFTDCISNFNGQKYMRTSASTWDTINIFGAGWLGVTSSMTLIRCTAKGNGAWGWYGGGSSPTTTDCIGDEYPTASKGNGCGTIPKGYSGGLSGNCIINVISSS
jgi:hypothetical protein